VVPATYQPCYILFSGIHVKGKLVEYNLLKHKINAQNIAFVFRKLGRRIVKIGTTGGVNIY